MRMSKKWCKAQHILCIQELVHRSSPWWIKYTFARIAFVFPSSCYVLFRVFQLKFCVHFLNLPCGLRALFSVSFMILSLSQSLMDSTLCGDPHYASFSSHQSALTLRRSSLKSDSPIKPLPPLRFQNNFTKRLHQQRHLHQLCLNEGSKCSGILGSRSQIIYSQWIPVQDKTMRTW